MKVKMKKLIVLIVVVALAALPLMACGNSGPGGKAGMLEGGWESSEWGDNLTFSDGRFFYNLERRVEVGTFEIQDDNTLVLTYGDGDTIEAAWAESPEDVEWDSWHVTEDRLYFDDIYFERTDNEFDFSILDNWRETLADYETFMDEFIDVAEAFLDDITNASAAEAYEEKTEELMEWLAIMETIEVILQADGEALEEFVEISERLTERALGLLN